MSSISFEQTCGISIKMNDYYFEKYGKFFWTKVKEPGLITIEIKEKDYDEHERIDNFVWDNYGCYSISWEITYAPNDYESPFTAIHYYKFDDGEIRTDFKGNMAELIDYHFPTLEEELEASRMEIEANRLDLINYNEDAAIDEDEEIYEEILELDDFDTNL